MVKEWIVNWFVENTGVTKEDIILNLNVSYFEKKWLDSYAFINFISDIEEKFDISFSNEEFQNREFATIEGLACIIERKISG